VADVISTDYIISLYHRYLEDLKEVRRQQKWFLMRRNNTLLRRLYKMRLLRTILWPMLDDLEAEITYLLIRDRDPRSVIEMSPNGGWSTTWILQALKDNGQGGQLWSYDLHDTSTKLVPNELARGAWHFVLGDVRQTIQNSPGFDYLFIDSDHTKEFAEWYVQTLLARARPGCVVSVHDVFHGASPSDEGLVVAAWLRDRGISYWSPAPATQPHVTRELIEERLRLGIRFDVRRRRTSNPMMFFEIAPADAGIENT
jgi:predicted O-methyltransferase YrrM